MTQKERIEAILRKAEASVYQIQNKLPQEPRPSIRRVLGQGTKNGVFKRLGKGVYTLTTNEGLERAYIEVGKAEDVLPVLATQGRKFDSVFLDPAYFSRALIGGNRGIKSYGFIYPEKFKIVCQALAGMMRTPDSHVYLMLSGAPSAQKDMINYVNCLVEADFNLCVEGKYKKPFANGQPVTNVRGLEAAGERLILFTQSGGYRAGESELQMDFKVQRPSIKKGYATQKAPEFVRQVIRQSTFEGELIADPFLGSGIVAVEALAIGRRIVGVEVSQETIDNYILPKIQQYA